MSFIMPFVGLLVGFWVVYHSEITVPPLYANYLAVSVLATLDSLVGGWRAGIDHHFDREIFLSGFFMNAIVAFLLAYFGDLIGVPLTMVASIVFGVRIFNNLSIVRTHWIMNLRNRQAAGNDAKDTPGMQTTAVGTSGPVWVQPSPEDFCV